MSFEIQAQTDGDDRGRQAVASGAEICVSNISTPFCAAAALQITNWREISARTPLELPFSFLTYQ
jgi:hypothetical protein